MAITPASIKAALDGDIANMIVAFTPGGIEAQEAQGQRDMASRFITLPKEMRCPHGGPWHDDEGGCSAGWKVAQEFGFRITVGGDDIFHGVGAPDGWEIRPTEHAMHSDIVDDRGRVRGGIFYKAAFYDRRAAGNWVTRYQARTDYSREYRSVVACDAIDTETGDVLFHSEIICGERKNWLCQDEADKLVTDWLTEHFPQWRDVAAYWN